MTDDLRERVIAMADDLLLAPPMDRSDYMIRDLALAVAAMVAEECARECERLSGKALRLEYAECAAAIRALEP